MELASNGQLGRRRLLVCVIILIAGIFWLTRKPDPPVSIVNGLYSNPCCHPILIRDGVIVTGSDGVRFTLRLMKFGLEATPSQNLSVEEGGVQATRTDDAHRVYIIFDDDRRGFTLSGSSAREFHFRR